MSPPCNNNAQWCIVATWGTPQQIKSNHMQDLSDETLDAINALAEALVRNPEDVSPLMLYGQFPEHLMDIIGDYFPEDEDEI